MLLFFWTYLIFRIWMNPWGCIPNDFSLSDPFPDTHQRDSKPITSSNHHKHVTCPPPYVCFLKVGLLCCLLLLDIAQESKPNLNNHPNQAWILIIKPYVDYNSRLMEGPPAGNGNGCCIVFLEGILVSMNITQIIWTQQKSSMNRLPYTKQTKHQYMPLVSYNSNSILFKGIFWNNSMHIYGVNRVRWSKSKNTCWECWLAIVWLIVIREE